MIFLKRKSLKKYKYIQSKIKNQKIKNQKMEEKLKFAKEKAKIIKELLDETNSEILELEKSTENGIEQRINNNLERITKIKKGNIENCEDLSDLANIWNELDSIKLENRNLKANCDIPYNWQNADWKYTNDATGQLIEELEEIMEKRIKYLLFTYKWNKKVDK
jgi:hypothetical protein